MSPIERIRSTVLHFHHRKHGVGAAVAHHGDAVLYFLDPAQWNSWLEQQDGVVPVARHFQLKHGMANGIDLKTVIPGEFRRTHEGNVGSKLLRDARDLLAIGRDNDAIDTRALPGGFDGPAEQRLPRQRSDVLAGDTLGTLSGTDEA